MHRILTRPKFLRQTFKAAEKDDVKKSHENAKEMKFNKIANDFHRKYFGVQCHFTFIASRSLSPWFCELSLSLILHRLFLLQFYKFEKKFVICVRHFCLEFYGITQLCGGGGSSGATVINFIVWFRFVRGYIDTF